MFSPILLKASSFCIFSYLCIELFLLLVDDDFQLSANPAIVIIPSRASRRCLTITIIRSALVERDEEINLSISEDTLAVIEDPATTLVIKEGRCKGLIFL